jgi:hypothetical protein
VKHRVSPFRLTAVVNLDSLLLGKAALSSADPRITAHWTTTPKHFTMFAVKFVNPFHGQYLHYGSAKTREAGSPVTVDSTYRAGYTEDNEVIQLTTTGRTQVSLNAFYKSQTMNGLFTLLLNFDSDDYTASGGVNCTVEAPAGAAYTVTGSGNYSIGSEEFGNKKRDAVYLNYTITTDTHVYSANDVFVFRDKGVNMETYEIVISE